MTLFQADNLQVEQHPDGSAVLWLDVPGRSLNVFNRQVLADLDAALDRVAATPAVQVLIVRSRKPAGFLAGADLHEFTAVRDATDAMKLSEVGQRLFDKVAGLRVPVVAVLHGPCLGGGLEFALACDYRLVVDQPGTQIGLPEIELGLLPGWGGTQRLPRLIGLERALRVILGRHRLHAREARSWHLADVLASEPDLPAEVERLASRARAEGKRLRQRLPLTTWRQRLVESNPAGRWLVFRGTERMLRRVPDDMPAPREALNAVRVGLTRGGDAGFRYEREAIGRLAMTPACRHLVNLFFDREKARKVPEELRQAVGPVRRVGVVGGGTMGVGIAQLAAFRGCEVVLQEVNAEALGAGTFKIAALFQQAVARRLLSREEADRKLAAIKGTLTWEGFDTVDLVVEAVIENLDTKRAIFRELEQRTRPETVLATNTSSLSVTALQEGLTHPQRVAGLHFFNPVHKMPLVEVVRTSRTDEHTLALLTQWAVALGKTPVTVQDSPGFVVNRILMPYLNEAVMLVGEGMAVQDVDRVMRRFGMPMGPLELLDQVGLDVAAHIARSMQPTFGSRFAPNPAFEQMVQHGWLGQKGNWGFYRYRGKGKMVNAAAVELLRASPPPTAASFTALGLEEQRTQARERMVLGMVNEAAACLGEHLAADAETIDLAMVLGTGWAPHRGGPLHYADDRGPKNVLQALTELTQQLGPRFEPAAELRRHADNSEPFCRAQGSET